MYNSPASLLFFKTGAKPGEAMSLNKRLQFLHHSLARNAGPEVSHVCEQVAQNQSCLASWEGVVLHCPACVPDVTLVADDGSRHSIREMMAGKPAVLVFFRGDWCPYSTTSMRAFEAIRADLARHGALLIGITPRHHSALAAMAAKNLLGFPLLTDPEQKLIEAMGICSRTVEPMIALFRRHGIDLARMNESGGWSLPLEATFLVDGEGRVRWANAYPHPSRRAEPEDVRDKMLLLLAQPEAV